MIKQKSLEKEYTRIRGITMANLPSLLQENSKKYPQKNAFWYKDKGIYSPLTNQFMWDNVQKLAASLKSFGITPHDKVALLSYNRPEWVVADLAIMALGSAVVPIYSTLSESEIAYIIQDSQSKLAIVETKEHLDKVKPLLNTSLSHIITIEKLDVSDPNIVALSDILSAQVSSEDLDLSFIKESDLASIVYTSGTTGDPKGVMLSHGNFLSNVSDICAALPLTEHTRVLSFLPLAHVFERTGGYYTVLAIGGTIYYAESIDTLSENLLEAKPTVLVSVPRVYEKIHAKLMGTMTPLKKMIFYWAKSVGKHYLTETQPSLALTLKHRLADVLVFSKIREKTGGNIQFCVSGGAALAAELCDFFQCLGLTIIEGYGMTESSPVISCNRLGRVKPGTVGLALDNVHTRLSADGELQVKGPNIMMGYLNKPEKTAEVLDQDGWLSTGDIAEIDSDGYIAIVDRIKDLIVLSNGKKVAPQEIENSLKLNRFVSQIVVIGEKRNFVTALIVPEKNLILETAKTQQWSDLPYEELLKASVVIDYVKQEIDKRQAALSHYKQIKKFVLLPNELTQDAGELTPSLKPKRKVIRAKYAAQIAALYDEG